MPNGKRGELVAALKHIGYEVRTLAEMPRRIAALSILDDDTSWRACSRTQCVVARPEFEDNRLLRCLDALHSARSCDEWPLLLAHTRERRWNMHDRDNVRGNRDVEGEHPGFPTPRDPDRAALRGDDSLSPHLRHARHGDVDACRARFDDADAEDVGLENGEDRCPPRVRLAVARDVARVPALPGERRAASEDLRPSRTSRIGERVDDGVVATGCVQCAQQDVRSHRAHRGSLVDDVARDRLELLLRDEAVRECVRVRVLRRVQARVAVGLDVQILSPPHVVLAVGIIAIALGAMLGTLAHQNRTDARGGWIDRGYAYAAGLVLTFVAILSTEYTDRILHHSSIFYMVACGAFPFVLVGAARASRLRWPATAIAGTYTAITLAMVWLLPLFAAEPLLGPIRRQITHMVPMDFPLLLIAPAIALDIAAHRARERRDWLTAVAYGAIFFVVLFAVQYPFSSFLMSPWSMNPVFATTNFDYAMPDSWYKVRREFYPWDANATAKAVRLGVAVLLAIASTRLGLAGGTG